MDQQYEDFKKQVKDSSDIVDVIGGYISLQKKGRYYWACCPFHGEKTPSFSVDKERQFFYCYGEQHLPGSGQVAGCSCQYPNPRIAPDGG